MKKICGFVVVRLAELNFSGEEFGELVPPQIDGIYYGGIERLDWIEVSDAYYSKTLPTHLNTLYRQLENLSAARLTKRFEIAQELLTFSNRKEPLDEIIAIYSEGIEATCGSFISDKDIHWRGEDVICWMGSMLREGLFTQPYLFAEFKPELNQYGLFDIDSQITDLYVEHYNKLSIQGHVLEDFLDAMSSLDKVWIGELKT